MVTTCFQMALDLSATRRALPIFPAREILIKEFKSSLCCLVVGETGSGKTTQIPQVSCQMLCTFN